MSMRGDERRLGYGDEILGDRPVDVIVQTVRTPNS
jgi:hypothetical protein